MNMEDLGTNDAYAVCCVLGFFATPFKLINIHGEDVSISMKVPNYDGPSIIVFEF